VKEKTNIKRGEKTGSNRKARRVGKNVWTTA